MFVDICHLKISWNLKVLGMVCLVPNRLLTDHEQKLQINDRGDSRPYCHLVFQFDFGREMLFQEKKVSLLLGNFSKQLSFFC